MDKKEILQILQNHLQTFESNSLGWELNGINEDDIEEVAEEIVKKLSIHIVSKRSELLIRFSRYLRARDLILVKAENLAVRVKLFLESN